MKDPSLTWHTVGLHLPPLWLHSFEGPELGNGEPGLRAQHRDWPKTGERHGKTDTRNRQVSSSLSETFRSVSERGHEIEESMTGRCVSFPNTFDPSASVNPVAAP